VPDNEALMAWLQANRRPRRRAAIIHNDYKFDNVVLGRERRPGWRITGVLDWEMATIGDPLMDLGASLAYWIQADDPSSGNPSIGIPGVIRSAFR
jgi:aminoglycoside phosphotransferase (APT) family kinase protein